MPEEFGFGKFAVARLGRDLVVGPGIEGLIHTIVEITPEGSRNTGFRSGWISEGDVSDGGSDNGDSDPFGFAQGRLLRVRMTPGWHGRWTLRIVADPLIAMEQR
jgi:hypothetical protein